MFPDLEFVKTCLNAITAKFRRVKSDVDAVRSDVDAVRSDVDAVRSDVDAVNRSAPDWNESDTASHSYVKNKPCYDYIEPSVVIWESDSAGTSDRSPLVLVDLVDGRLIEGETYRLTVDGVETTYTCAAASNGLGLYIGAGFASFNGGIYQSHTDTILRAYTSNLWGEGQKVRLEGPLRRYKKLDISLYDAVTSVNGETGEVEITPESIGAAKVKSMYSDGHPYDAIYGTISGNTCDSLYLGVKTFIQRRIFAGTNEACFRFGYGESPIILAGIKTPTSNDHAANKGYVDKTVAPDTTLSIAGKSADAKATGDAIRSLSEEIVNLPQADWNQNDSTAADYVKNRPFYSDTAEIEIVTEGERGNLLEGFPAFAVGDTVTVKVDGMEHSLVAYEDNGSTTIGDAFSSLESGEGQLGWKIIVIENELALFFATEAHTVAYLGINHHKIDQKYLPTQRVTFTKSYHNDGALDNIMSDEEVLDSVVLNIPVLKASSYPTDQIVCSPDGTLFLHSEYISLGTFEPDRIEINSNTLTSETFELVVPSKDICKLTVLDIYTKTRCNVYFPMLDKVGTDSSVGAIINTFTQSVAYINGHLFSFCTSSLSPTGAGRTIVLTVKKIL